MPLYHFQGQTVTEMSSDGRAKYPQNSITSAPQRDTVKLHLVKPLVDQGRVAMALRITWRVNGEMVWKQILTQRVACDQFVKGLSGVAFFVSSITGTVGKAAHSGAAKIVYPAVGYWIVLDSAAIDPRAIVRNITNVLHGQAEVRLIKEPPIVDSLEGMHNTICNVMKDHANGYIKQRIETCQAQPQHATMPYAGNAARMVANSEELETLAKQSRANMQLGGVQVDIVNY